MGRAPLPYGNAVLFGSKDGTYDLQNGGTLEYAQTIANHESPRTTKLYDRTLGGSLAGRNRKDPDLSLRQHFGSVLWEAARWWEQASSS